MLQKLRIYPLLGHILLYVFAATATISLAAAGLQLYFAYQNEKKHIDAALDVLGHSQLTALVNNLWNLDRHATEIQLNSILEHPDIDCIELHDEKGKIAIFGKPPDDPGTIIERSYPLLMPTAQGTKNLGSLLVVASTVKARARLWQSTRAMLAAQLLSLVVICLCVLFIFIQLFNRHINAIARHAESWRLGHLDQPIRLKRATRPAGKLDELDYIVNTLNSMRERIHTEAEAQQFAKKRLGQEKHFSDAIINSLPSLLFVIDERQHLVRFNAVFDKLTGFQLKTGMALPITRYIAPENIPEMQQAIESVLHEGRQVSLETTVISGKGSKHPHLFTITRLQLDDELLVIGIATDLTSQKRIESQLRQAQKMEAIGTLAGGIAHDFNNILSAVMGYNQLAMLECPMQSAITAHLEEVHRATMRAKDLVGQILSFSRKTDVRKQSLQPALIVKEALKLLRASIPSSIEIRQKLDCRRSVYADPTEVHQIVMNLCTNAYQAIPEGGGVISVSLSEQQLGEDDYLPHQLPLTEGSYVRLDVADTGSGFDETAREKIFEPYYTTKESGVGTGLGLAVVHGIVHACHGAISVYSTPGKGTTFSVFLPVVDLPPANAPERPNPLQLSSLQGTETILIVDDDSSVLDFYRKLLHKLGYHTLAYSSSILAFDYLKNNPQAVQLVITDLTMPGISGERLAQEIWAIRPQLPVIINSGFAAGTSREEFLAAGFADFFIKPVESTAFLQRIREILNTTSRHQRVASIRPSPERPTF